MTPASFLISDILAPQSPMAPPSRVSQEICRAFIPDPLNGLTLMSLSSKKYTSLFATLSPLLFLYHCWIPGMACCLPPSPHPVTSGELVTAQPLGFHWSVGRMPPALNFSCRRLRSPLPGPEAVPALTVPMKQPLQKVPPKPEATSESESTPPP